MTLICGTGVDLPGKRHSQQSLLPILKEAWRGCDYDDELLDYMFDRVGVDGRHLAMSPEAYIKLDDFGEANDYYIESATQLGAEALKKASASADIAVEELDALFFTTVTGVASPSIDAKIINELELSRHVERVPMFGLGCVGGAAGLARVGRYLEGTSAQHAALLSVELCSLTLERNDPGVADIIAASLFGDGATSVVCSNSSQGRNRVEPKIVDSKSVLYRDTEWVMGWNFTNQGFELVLSGDLPEVIETELREDLQDFLGDHGYTIEDIEEWICHPGGPRVVEAVEEALGLDSKQLASARASLRNIGNLSSSSVLHVLDRTLSVARNENQWQSPAVLMAMGPGFSAEFVLIESCPR